MGVRKKDTNDIASNQIAQDEQELDDQVSGEEQEISI